MGFPYSVAYKPIQSLCDKLSIINMRSDDKCPLRFKSRNFDGTNYISHYFANTDTDTSNTGEFLKININWRVENRGN